MGGLSRVESTDESLSSSVFQFPVVKVGVDTFSSGPLLAVLCSQRRDWRGFFEIAKSHSNPPPVSGHGAGYLDLALPIAITRNGHVYDEADSCPEAERGFRLGEFLDQEAMWSRWSTRSPDAYSPSKFSFPPEDAYSEAVDVGECRERQVAQSSRGHPLPALEPPNGVEGDRRSLGEGGNQVVMAHGWT